MVLCIFSQIVTFLLFDEGLRKIIKENISLIKESYGFLNHCLLDGYFFLTYEILSRFYPLRIRFIEFSFFRDLLFKHVSRVFNLIFILIHFILDLVPFSSETSSLSSTL